MIPSLRRPFSSLSRTTTPTDLSNVFSSISEVRKKTVKHASEIHTQLAVNGYFSLPFLVDSLVKLYAQSGKIRKAIILSSSMSQQDKDLVSWTSLIIRLSRCSMYHEALSAFKRMRNAGVYPNEFTFPALMLSCSGTRDLLNGTQMHALGIKSGFDEQVPVGSAMIDMYAKCFDLDSAEQVFDELPEINIETWNSLIEGYLDNGLYGEAVLSFKEVLNDVNLTPDEVSCLNVLHACANTGGDRLLTGEQMHGFVIRKGLFACVKNTLMDMYSKCGSIDVALMLFSTITNKDAVTWNVRIGWFVQENNFDKACEYFWMAKSEGVSMDEVSYSTVLHSCEKLAAFNQGVMVHSQVIKTAFLTDVSISSALVRLYGTCGSLVEALRVFEEIVNCSVTCWTAMIGVYQQRGYADRAIELFERMLKRRKQPDSNTFLRVLSACADGGNIEQGFTYFNSMDEFHSVDPSPEHYACMVDLLGRAGQLEQALDFIESMPEKAGPLVWRSLLRACRYHKDLQLGALAAEMLLKVEPDNPENYLLVSKMYERGAHRLMEDGGFGKEQGCSWVEIKGSKFDFKANDGFSLAMVENVKALFTKKGCMEVNGYDDAAQHSEKAALAFGLMALPAEAPIRINHNLSTCDDCHTLMKFSSLIFGREIILKDIDRFHHFANGSCSCGDYY